MADENKHAGIAGRSAENKGHQGGGVQSSNPARAQAVPIKIDGGYQGPTGQSAPKNPPSGGSGGSKK